MAVKCLFVAGFFLLMLYASLLVSAENKLKAVLLSKPVHACASFMLGFVTSLSVLDGFGYV